MKKTFLILFLFFSVFLFAGSSASAATFNVKCDGSSDQVQINQALQSAAASPGSIVHLQGRCVASGIIYIGRNTTLEGEPGTVLTFADGFWPDASLNQALIMYNSGLSKSQGPIIIRGFEIDGNFNDTVSHACSKRTFMFVEAADGFEVYDMYWHNSCNDGIKIKNSQNLKIHDLRIDTLGHDSIVVQGCHNGEVYNNKIQTRGNAGVRLFGSGFIKIHDNFIYAVTTSGSPGGPGLELQRNGKQGDNLHDLEIYNNFFYRTCQVGIQLIGYGTSYTREEVSNIHIHHNIFVECGWNKNIDWVAGISIGGIYNVVIENNTFDGNYGGAIIYMESMGLQSAGTSGKYDVYVRNNIITNTKKRGGDAYDTPGSGTYTESGQGVINYSPAEGSLFLENNLLYGNIGGNYKNVSSPSDIYQDPFYADPANRDYHIKSRAGRWDPKAKSWVTDSVSSPAIDGGNPSSVYTNEPENNGDRINIGRYGNTTQASLTGTSPQNPMPPDPVEDFFVGFEGGSGSGSGGGSATPSWNPSGSILDDNPYSNIDPALPTSENPLSPWWSRLAELFALRDSTEGGRDISIFFSNSLLSDDPVVLINNFLGFVLSLASGLGLLFLLLGGLTYISSAGDIQKAARGKKMVIYAIGGLVLVIFSYALLEIVEGIFVD